MKRTKEHMNEFVQSLNQISWNAAAAITPEAEFLIQEHLAKMQKVIKYLANTKGLKPIEAYAEAQSAGYDAAGYDTFMKMLFHEVKFSSAGPREPLILTICGYYFWDADHDLGHLENPWAPLMRLYEMGYTSSFDEDERSQTLDVIIDYHNGFKLYKLISGENIGSDNG
jgi:hypothetical protein